jgi:hypothetical protein
MARKPSLSNKIEATFLTEGDLFKALAGSAFEFLDRAIDEFSISTKFSTIHFASAIELFLKARLMKEHWSLLLDKPDQADKIAFFKGDAKTVSPEQTVDRLRKIAQVTITQDCREIFSKIAKHRNKMIHFAHAGELNSDAADGQSVIAAEQCAGWLALRTLLEGWPEFKAFKKEITRISKKMNGHRIYLQQIFESKAAELQAHRQAGHRVNQCPSCQFESMKVGAPIGAISEASCVVCHYTGAQIKVNCCEDGCGKAIDFSSYDGPPSECPKCHSKLSKDDIVECLNTGQAITKDNYFDYVPINCPYCSGYHSVVEHHNFYVCTDCFEIGENYEICGHCSEGQLGGVPEHSSLVGCEFCDGSNAWQKDD